MPKPRANKTVAPLTSVQQSATMIGPNGGTKEVEWNTLLGRLSAISVASLFIVSPALAICTADRFDVRFNGETVRVQARVSAGTECNFPFTMYGPIAHTTSASIVGSAKRGAGSASGSGARYVAGSSRGRDEFSVRVCGVSTRGPGCTTVGFFMDVE